MLQVSDVDIFVRGNVSEIYLITVQTKFYMYRINECTRDSVVEIIEPTEALTGQRIPSYFAEECRIYRVPQTKLYINSKVVFLKKFQIIFY